MKRGLRVSNKDKAKNATQIIKGKIKAATGKKFGNQKLEAEGQSDQVKGNLKQAGEKVKDALQE
jgi:uncharacterized protein YjbJ (UPF0337 family)